MDQLEELIASTFAAFKAEAMSTPPMSLRAGDAVDDYTDQPSYSAQADAITDDYLREFRWGLPHLDSASWRHYLPHLLAHAAKHHALGSDVTDALIQNLRPPDRGQLSSLSADQQQVVIKVLDLIAFCETSPHSQAAQTALEEWWAPGALYRPASI
ncbi:hypothetical protein LXT12_03220 [Pelomonas sp. P7]|uniref:Uncharacterized protein n=1 Tax=Pelomonas caseinilytica TaxID=2906763 RepID=A0ABS8XBJ9_9BURK|nr:DUF6714 family protein [Pelomonas sp. P7]MCE4536268.1 hypothetical protein [Pelomonas sp. P7]